MALRANKLSTTWTSHVDEGGREAAVLSAEVVSNLPVLPCHRLWYVLWDDGIEEDNEWQSIFTCGGFMIKEWRFNRIGRSSSSGRSSSGSSSSGSGRLEHVASINLIGTHTKSARKISVVTIPKTKERYLAVASFDSKVSIWKNRHNEMTWTFNTFIEGHQNEVKGISIKLNKYTQLLTIATAGRDHTVWIHNQFIPDQMNDSNDDNVNSNDDKLYFSCDAVLSSHTQDVKSVIFHPTLPILLSTSYDNTARTYTTGSTSTTTGELSGTTGTGTTTTAVEWTQSQVFQNHTETVWDGTFSPDGEYMATCGADGIVNVYINKRNYNSQNNNNNNIDPTMTAIGVFKIAFAISQSTTRISDWRIESEIDLKIDTANQNRSIVIYSISWFQQDDKDNVHDDLLALACDNGSILIYRRSRSSSNTTTRRWTLDLNINAAHNGYEINCVRWMMPYHPNKYHPILAAVGDDGEMSIWQIIIPNNQHIHSTNDNNNNNDDDGHDGHDVS